MGRKRLFSRRVSCRISNKAGKILDVLHERIPYGRKRPMAKILSFLIENASPETWQEIIRTFPRKSGPPSTTKEFKRRGAERQIRESQEWKQNSLKATLHPQ